MTSRPYLTLGKSGREQFIINKSRFIGIAEPVTSEEAAQQFLEAVRAEFRDANHHCYAYIIGQNAGIMRYQDDGEPSGTAGQPIIEVMKVKRIVNACVVVVRYFGGVLLGAGGLTRAYSRGASVAIGASGIVSMEPTVFLQVEVPYTLWDKLQHRLQNLPVLQDEAEFCANVIAHLRVRLKDLEGLEKALLDMSDGRAFILETGRDYFAWPEPEEAPSA